MNLKWLNIDPNAGALEEEFENIYMTLRELENIQKKLQHLLNRKNEYDFTFAVSQTHCVQCQ